MQKDFFISHAGSDKDIALIIAKIIQEAGFKTWLQDEDFGHASFMERMAQGFSCGARMISLLSSTYQKSDYCKKEYSVTLSDDPLNLNGQLIVLRVDEVAPVELLKDLAYYDLVPLLKDADALTSLVRVAIGAETDQKLIDFASLHHRSPGQILHREIKSIPDLVDRKGMLQALDELLHGKNPECRTVLTDVASVLHGLGGVGKTILAKQYAWQYRNRYAGIWWIRAETSQDILSDLLSLGKRLIPGIAEIPDLKQAGQIVLDELSTRWEQNGGIGKPWLLIYDNAEDPKSLEDYLPRQGAEVIITSRWTDWHSYASTLQVDVFSSQMAITFLLEQSHEQDHDSAAQLALDLGYLPLALDQARTYCWRSRCSFEAYRKRLSTLIQKAPLHQRYPSSVYATFDLALEKAKGDAPESELAINLLAYFASDLVPRFLLFDALEESCDDALMALSDYSLIDFGQLEDQLKDGTEAISLHRLVQEVARHRSIEEKHEVISRCLELIIKRWPGTSNPKTWPVRRALFPHAMALLEKVDEEQNYGQRVALLLTFVGAYLGGIGSYSKAEPLNRRALAR